MMSFIERYGFKLPAGNRCQDIAAFGRPLFIEFLNQQPNSCWDSRRGPIPGAKQEEVSFRGPS